MKLYLAGPLFSTAERRFNAELAARLRQNGHEIFVPQEQEQRADDPRSIFDSDVGGIDWADAVVANMDGSDPDSGTCWECGYAYAKHIPIILFRTDFRAAHESAKAPYNLMLTESASLRIELPFATIEEIAQKLTEGLASLEEFAPAENG